MAKQNWPSGRPKGWTFLQSPVISNFETGREQRNMSASYEIDAISIGSVLGDGARGALVLPSGRLKDASAGRVNLHCGDFDEAVVKFSLLMFENIDCPKNNLANLGPEKPEGLEGEAFLGVTRVSISGEMSESAFSAGFFAAFSALDGESPGRWSVARGAQESGLPPEAFGEMTGFRIRLENALPIPSREVCYEDVMNYKERRKNELLSLRYHLDDLSLKISQCESKEFTKNIELEKFIKSLDDYTRVISEENFSKRLASLEVNFNWSGLIVGAIASLPLAAVSVSGFGAAFWGACASSITVGSTLGLRGKRDRPSPFDYVLMAGRDL